MTLAAIIIAAQLTGADPLGAAARVTCSAPLGSELSAEGVEVRGFPADDGELAGLRVRHLASGAWMNVYFDPPSEAAVRSRAACLGLQLGLIHDLVQDDRADVQWSSVAFSAALDTVTTRSGAVTRWVVPTTDGALDDEAQQIVVVVVPHEQVHAFQTRAGASSPRWFAEGHAEWLGRQVTETISPEWAVRHAARRAGDLAASNEPVALGKWGGLSVKREAILRQVSAEDRRRMETDPEFAPQGAFSFGPDDMTADESNTPARYQAAWTVFRDMEAASSVEAVEGWVKGATEAAGRVTSARLVETARSGLGFDLTARLE